jgi:MFS family permease
MKWQLGVRHCAAGLSEEVTVTTKQFSALFLCSLIVWTLGSGLLPLLPVYAAQIGAGPVGVGAYLSFSYLALAMGTVIAGWLSDRLQRRKALLIAAGVLGIPAIWLMGRVATLWQLTALTATVWFVGGAMLALVSILTGLFAKETERGRVFGFLLMTSALGSLLGGLTTGPVVDRWGYATLFTVLCLFWSLSPLIALLLEDKVIARLRPSESAVAREKSGFGASFFLLLLASLAAGLALNVGLMSRSLVMHSKGFSAAAISGTGAAGGAATLPLPAVLGWLADRGGRRRLLVLCCLAGTAGLLALAVSTSLWHLCVAISLLNVLLYVGSVGSAMVTDLIPQGSLGRGLSLFTATTWAGGVVGYAGTGYAVQRLGMTPTLIMGAFLPLIAVALLIPVRETARESDRSGSRGQ